MIPTTRALKLQNPLAATRYTLTAAIDTIASYGVFDAVWLYAGWGRAMWRSDLLDPVYWTTGYDPLQVAIERCASHGLKLVPIWTAGCAPESSTFRTRHPTWDVAAIPAINGRFHWLNFSLPEVREFCAQVICEIAARYNVPAIHLDYIRYWAGPPYDAIARPSNLTAADITTTVNLCAQRLKAQSPNVQLGAHTMAGLNDGEQQRWANWTGLAYAAPMAYYDTNEDSTRLNRHIAAWKAQPVPVQPCLAIRNVSINSEGKPDTRIIAEASAIRDAGYTSVAWFDYPGMTASMAATLKAWDKPVVEPPPPPPPTMPDVTAELAALSSAVTATYAAVDATHAALNTLKDKLTS